MDKREKIARYQMELYCLAKGWEVDDWDDLPPNVHQKYLNEADQILKLIEPEFYEDRVEAIKDILKNLYTETVKELRDRWGNIEAQKGIIEKVNTKYAQQISALPIEVELEKPNEIDYQRAINEYMDKNNLYSDDNLLESHIYKIREEKIINSIIQQLARQGIKVKVE